MCTAIERKAMLEQITFDFCAPEEIETLVELAQQAFDFRAPE